MDRKATAKETLRILQQGYYEYEKKQIDISKEHQKSIEETKLITPEQGALLVKEVIISKKKTSKISVKNMGTVQAILESKKETEDINQGIGVLNFASAKNPGGGFLNGAMAQEESLAASSGLYETLLKCPTYYKENRNCNSMMYTNFAIYSPQVVFFRDKRFSLIEKPVQADVLTIPAVNMGQVILKNEDITLAKKTMRDRMKLILAIFEKERVEHLILGAYGCGVFRNNPEEIAKWWKELLEEGYGEAFEHIIFAVLDNSEDKNCIRAFENIF